MLASAPFDDWWHNAYGLDVRIISPPHMVLAAGFFGIELGTVHADARVHEPRARAAAAGARAPVSVRRRHGAVRIVADQARIDQPVGSAQRALLHRRADRHARNPGGADDCVGAKMGEHDHRRGLQRVRARVPVDPAAVPGVAEARAGASTGDPLHSMGVPAAHHRARVRDGSDSSADARVAADRPRAGGGVGILRGLRRRAVAVCQFPADAVGAQLVFRRRLPRLRYAGPVAAGSLRVLLP